MKSISKDKLFAWLRELKKPFKVYVPTKEAGGDVMLAPMGEEEPLLDYGRLWEAPKRLLLPQWDAIVSLREEGAAGHYDTQKRLLFGLRPCDAAAIKYLDDFYSRDFADPHYLTRRKNSLLLIVACEAPEETCFCRSAGTGPAAEAGFDLQFYRYDRGFIVEVGSQKGKELTEKWPNFFQEGPKDAEHIAAQLKEEAGKRFKDEPNMEEAARIVDRGEVDEDFWEDIARSCLNCGGCAYICPTCTCFNMVERKEGERAFSRIRTWDSCIFAGYTREASGHNPRDLERMRLARRYEDKLGPSGLSWPRFRCVGCGRCQEVCLVQMGSKEVVRQLLTLMRKKSIRD